MQSITEHNGTLTIIERLPSSINGNPRYLAAIDGYTVRTKPDSSIGYCLPNYAGTNVKVLIGTHYGKPTIAGIWSN